MFALTREQKGREAPLLRVGVERVVGHCVVIDSAVGSADLQVAAAESP